MPRPEYTSNVSVTTEANSVTSASIFGTLTIGTAASEIKVGAEKLAQRTGVLLQADKENTESIYIGVNSAPTENNASFRMIPGAGIEIALEAYGDAVLHAIAAAADQKLHVTELK